MHGKIFCLDGSPLSLKTILQTQLKSLTEDQLQNMLLLRMSQIMTKRSSNDLQQYLNEKTWKEKIDATLRFMRGIVEEPFEFQRLVIESAWKRIVQALEYKRKDKKLSSDVVLLRANCSTSLPNDYGLKELTDNTVTVYPLDSTHISAPNNLNCSDIINRELNLDKSTVSASIVRLNKLNSSIDGRMIR